MGEFGFAEAYERKIEEIKPWLTNENERVRKFSADYVTSLKNQAKSERHRAEEDIELRKHAYGVREEKAGEEDGASEQRETANEDDGKEPVHRIADSTRRDADQVEERVGDDGHEE